ncbi:MAG: PA2778 family cysteine peptidase, partial [Limnobacter sp.]|nr:PA2778 family cysteine peptidase [Limnobacter sp.]
AITPDVLTGEIFTPGREGTLQTDVLAGSRRFGFMPYPISSYKELHQSLQAEHPVLTLLNLSLPIYPRWHYAVVYGYEDGNYLLRSGQKKEEKFSEFTMDNLWQRSDYWGVVLLSPSQAPPSFATADKWLNTALGMERANANDALQAYSSGLTRWPEDARFAFALGNSFYGQDQKQLAKNFLERAVEIDPDFADAWNNLAQIRFELKDHAGAAQAIDRAIELGGKRLDFYKQTQQKIQAERT